jgi:polar amino acid transport system substrate-binding protein
MLRIVLLLLAALVAPQAVAETIKLYMYHQQPPFILGAEAEQRGLIYELSQLLERHAASATRFVPMIRPRSRLNLELQPWISNACPGATTCANNWMVFWVTPAWGWGPDAERRFLWVDLFADEDLIISRTNLKLDYQQPSSLIGYRFAALRGHFYPQGLEELMEQGKIIRLDGDSRVAVLFRVQQGRADVTLMQRSTLDYYLAQDAQVWRIREQLQVASKSFKSFTLQVMIPRDRPDLQQLLEQLKATQAWRELFLKYGLEPL